MNKDISDTLAHEDEAEDYLEDSARSTDLQEKRDLNAIDHEEQIQDEFPTIESSSNPQMVR